MGLFAKDEPGQAMFFSPGKIAVVRLRQQELKGQKERQKLAKEAEKNAKRLKESRKLKKLANLK